MRPATATLPRQRENLEVAQVLTTANYVPDLSTSAPCPSRSRQEAAVSCVLCFPVAVIVVGIVVVCSFFYRRGCCVVVGGVVVVCRL